MSETLSPQARYYRRKAGIPLDAPIKQYHKQVGECSVSGCNQPAKCMSYCKKHYDASLTKYGINGRPDHSWAKAWWKLRGPLLGWPRFCEVVRRKEMHLSNTKKCGRCGIAKRLDQFQLTTSIKNGKRYPFRHSYCTQCMNRVSNLRYIRKSIESGKVYRTRREILENANRHKCCGSKKTEGHTQQCIANRRWAGCLRRSIKQLQLQPSYDWNVRAASALTSLNTRPKPVKRTSLEDKSIVIFDMAVDKAWKNICSPQKSDWERKLTNAALNLRKRARRNRRQRKANCTIY